MDIYHIWCNLKDGVKDTEFCTQVDAYLGHLRERGDIVGHRLTRRKLGLGPAEFLEFHIMIEIENLAQLDQAFGYVAGRSGLVEGLHHCVNSLVSDVRFALYRDFPDDIRQFGDEKF